MGRKTGSSLRPSCFPDFPVFLLNLLFGDCFWTPKPKKQAQNGLEMPIFTIFRPFFEKSGFSTRFLVPFAGPKVGKPRRGVQAVC